MSIWKKISRRSKTGTASNDEASSAFESGINQMKGGGQPLPDSSRSFFESRFGSDFSDVRVHTDMAR